MRSVRYRTLRIAHGSWRFVEVTRGQNPPYPKHAEPWQPACRAGTCDCPTPCYRHADIRVGIYPLIQFHAYMTNDRQWGSYYAILHHLTIGGPGQANYGRPDDWRQTGLWCFMPSITLYKHPGDKRGRSLLPRWLEWRGRVTSSKGCAT